MLQAVISEPQIDLSVDKKPWDRQEGESAKWYMRFRNYLHMCARRSINATYEAEQKANSKEKQSKTRTKCGPEWYNAAKRYQWEARAHAWDREQEERLADVMRKVTVKCAFVSRPFRIVQLNILAQSLMHTLERGLEPALYIPLTKQLQAVMRDIAEEVAAWDVAIDASCDAAALIELERKNQRLAAIEQEREEEQEAELDAQLADLKRRGLLGKDK